MKRSRFTVFHIERPFPWLLVALICIPVWLAIYLVAALIVVQVADGRLHLD